MSVKDSTKPRKAPMSIRQFRAELTSLAPLLLSNNMCSDPLSEAAKIKKQFTSKRTKSEADHKNLRVIDWVYSGYWSEPGEVSIDETENTIDLDGFSELYIPGQNFERCLRNGATAFKLGKEVQRALIVNGEGQLSYDGPQSAISMLQDPSQRFVLTSPVVRMKATNWVTRIVIPSWTCAFELTVDDERLSFDALERITKAAGQFEGIGTWRPRYGRFTTALTELDA